MSKKLAAQLDREIAAAIAHQAGCNCPARSTQRCRGSASKAHAVRAQPSSMLEEHLFEVTGHVDGRQESHVVSAADEWKARTRFMEVQTTLKPRGREVSFEVRQPSGLVQGTRRSTRLHATAKRETKPERIFKEHHPAASIDREISGRGPFKRVVYWIYMPGQHAVPLGEGPTAIEAWRDACRRAGYTATR